MIAHRRHYRCHSFPNSGYGDNEIFQVISAHAEPHETTLPKGPPAFASTVSKLYQRLIATDTVQKYTPGVFAVKLPNGD